MGTKTEIQQAPTVPAPSASQSAEDIYQARLKYDPLIAQKEFELQQSFMPQQAALYNALYQQYYPQIARGQQALQRELYPQQSQILEAGATQALQGLQQPQDQLVAAMRQQATAGLTAQDPLLQQLRQQAQTRLGATSGYSPEEQTAINAIRDRETQRMLRGIQESANIGGGLYGGRREQREERALGELAQGYTAQDIDRLRQQQQLAFQQATQIPTLENAFQAQRFQQAGQVPTLESALMSQRLAQLTPYMQILYPQIGQQQPQISPYQYQSAVPSADQLYQAMYGASRPEFFASPGLGTQLIGMAGQIGGGAMAASSSIRYKKNIKLWAKQ